MNNTNTEAKIDKLIAECGSERSAIARLIGYSESLEDTLNKIRNSLGYAASASYVNINDKPKKKTRFSQPTLGEVTEYCKARCNKVDPQSFIDFYSSKGWMVGKNKMKDWRACVRTWEKRENETNLQNSGRHANQIDHSDTSWVDQYNAEYGCS